MDDAIRDLVREVLRRLAPGLGADGARGEVIVAVTGATVGHDAAVDQAIALILKGFRLRVICSEAAAHLVGDGLARGLAGFPNWEILPPHAWFAALMRARAVAVPLLSVNSLSKLAALIADDDTANLMLHALFAGKPLVLAADGVLPGPGREALGFGGAGRALRAAVEERLRTVIGYGAAVVALDGLAARVEAALPLAAATPSAVAPAPAAARGRRLSRARVVGAGEVAAAARAGADLYCDAAALVTPLAKEAAERHGVRIVKTPAGA
ncbi:conserved hypothetical protein [uncultured Alphaproteobacteria bacterium]|uniref:Flavoprotein domain-containing protein n=1 Tax=uncultured Alphaproteobacteria bacterium TaxID=91750 RepID=A0A212IV11_9PROT|nr:conserved hypothetical protein [uncultured Alphaproteobacteria bacterium]